MVDIILNVDGEALKPKFKTGDKVKLIDFYNSGRSVYKEELLVTKVIIIVDDDEDVSFRYGVRSADDNYEDWPEDYLELVKKTED